MALNTSLLPICLKCDAQCCKFGTPVVSAEERQKIIKLTKKDYFKKQGKYFIIPKNPCPYLTKGNKCSIQKIKPIDCQTYPYSVTRKGNKIIWGISQKCPAKFLLTNKYISAAKKLFNKIPISEIKKIAKLNKSLGFDIREKNQSFGLELILDMYGCDTKLFTKKQIEKFFIKICKEINMKRHGKPMFWIDNSQIPHLKGVSAVQFITTSNIVVHALDILGTVYVNIFSCKKFNTKKAEKISKDFFKAEKIIARAIEKK